MIIVLSVGSGIGSAATAVGAAGPVADEHSPAVLAAVARRFADCAPRLDSQDAGVVAALLRSQARPLAQELHAVRRLEILERSRVCGSAARAGVLAYSTRHAAPAPPPAAASSAGLSWTSPAELAVLAVVAAALAALMYGLVRDLGPPAPPRRRAGRGRWRRG